VTSAYVALSRASSVRGLELLRAINPRSVATDPTVAAFYRALRLSERATEAWLDMCKYWWDHREAAKVVGS
jgi:hypothetical protein